MIIFTCLKAVCWSENGLKVLSEFVSWSVNCLNDSVVLISSKIMTCSCCLFLNVFDCFVICAYVESVKYETLLPSQVLFAFDASEAPLDVGPLASSVVEEQAIIMFSLMF